MDMFNFLLTFQEQMFDDIIESQRFVNFLSDRLLYVFRVINSDTNYIDFYNWEKNLFLIASGIFIVYLTYCLKNENKLYSVENSSTRILEFV